MSRGGLEEAAADLLRERDAARAEARRLRSLLRDSLARQRLPCAHQGIGLPGCAQCDPRVREAAE